MSARPNPREILAAYGLNEGVIDGVLDLHAHELAEQIRNSEVPGKVGGFYGAELNAYLEGSDDAASLIDPEVSDG